MRDTSSVLASARVALLSAWDSYVHYCGRTKPVDESVWHRWSPFVPVRTIEGGISTSVWRRQKQDGSYEYSSRDDDKDEMGAWV